MGNVYYGSLKGDIKIFKSQLSIHGKNCITAVDNPVIALILLGRSNGDLDVSKIYHNGMPILVERIPGILEKLYNKPGYIYELQGDTFSHHEYLWRPEVTSYEKELTPLKKEYHENILNSLEKLSNDGLLKIYKYPNRPNYIPSDDSDLIDRYIRLEKEGIVGATAKLLTTHPELKERVLEKIKEDKVNVKRK